MKISIIIAVYNQQDNLEKCVCSVLEQNTRNKAIELLIIDDCSTDKTQFVIDGLKSSYKNIRSFKTDTNGGPGKARNLGLDHAEGEWILFLDSDDWLENDAIIKLIERIDLIESNLIKSERPDLISYDFSYASNSTIESSTSSRNDFQALSEEKSLLIKNFLSLKMDGSVIYTLVNKDIISNNNLRFSHGYHEDIDFIFKLYVFSKKISILKESIYIKNNRELSIVNTITDKHIIGLFRAYIEMFNFFLKDNSNKEEYLSHFFLGIIAIISTRIRQISSIRKNQLPLYKKLYDEHSKLLAAIPELKSLSTNEHFDTKYIKIYHFFIDSFKNGNKHKAEKINEFMDSIKNKTWSCYDLHHGLYLSSEEVRTCCKRFFVDGKMKGDVALLTPSRYAFSEYTLNNIFNEKKKLHIEINKGDSEKCSGCDFLEFKNWNKMQLEHISFEYHSICNMKCTYCSDTYYGGKHNQYDIESLLATLIDGNYLDKCNSIVWGGGEPTLGIGFESMLQKMSHTFPSIQQRVISNATTISNSIESGLNNNSVSLVTSIDAGTEQKFFEIRQNKQFHRVLKNLKKYSANKPENITIKYIFLDNNSDIHQIEEFVNNIISNGLTNCNFQISYDFNKEYVSEHDLALISIMHGLLVEQNVPLVFIDDLLRLRIKNSTLNYEYLSDILSKTKYSRFSNHPSSKKKIVIWGAGRQTDYLLNDTRFLTLYDVLYIVDNTSEKIGTTFLGIKIYEPSKLINKNEKVLISAVQNSAKMKLKYIELGLDLNDLVTDLII